MSNEALLAKIRLWIVLNGYTERWRTYKHIPLCDTCPNMILPDADVRRCRMITEKKPRLMVRRDLTSVELEPCGDYSCICAEWGKHV